MRYLCKAMQFTLCFLPVAALAQAGTACVEHGTVAQNNACAVKAFQEADTGLNILYVNVMQQLPQSQRMDLRHAQNSWIKGRTTRCKAATRGNETLPEAPRLYHECLRTATQERMLALERWLQYDKARPH